ncbi:MAG: hypothetical protein ACYDHF_05855 [Candidatus Cryosericum sp.]
MSESNMYSNEYVYSLQQQSEANYQRAVRAEDEAEKLREKILELQELLAEERCGARIRASGACV